MNTAASSKYDRYYEIARDKYREAWDRNEQVQRKASGGLGIAGIIVAFAINVTASATMTWWWAIPGMLLATTLVSGVLVLLPRTWKYDPDVLAFGAMIEKMAEDEATLEAANSYAVATEYNNKVVTQKAYCLIVEFASLGLAAFALVVTLTLGD